MKTNSSLTWVICCLILISSCGSSKNTQTAVPSSSQNQTMKTKSPENMTETDKYISNYKFLAIKEMQRAKIPASITLAQGILESSVGQSYVARNANNHFGIKCNSTWTGPTIKYDDDAENECFRSYASVDESYEDHSNHLSGNPRYSSLFSLDITDYKGWASGLKAAGYATRSNYAELIIGIIERYGLNELDQSQSTKSISSGKGSDNTAQFVYNGIPAVMVRQGDTYDKIIRDNKITMDKLVKYNDLEPDQPLHQDMILYLKTKKTKGKESYHIVKDGETMHQISQDYAIKLDNLLEMNLMVSNETPAEGEIIYLKQKRSDPPALRENVIVKKDEEKKDEPQETVFSDNQKKTIDQNNDFVMPAKETPKEDISTAPKEPEPQKTTDQPAVTNTSTTPTTPTDNSMKNDDLFAEKNTAKTPPPATSTASASTPAVATPATTPVVNNTVKPIAAASNTTDYHTVQKGESMFSISKQYGMKVVELQNLNGMNDYSIKIGQKLLVNKNIGQEIAALQKGITPIVKTSIPATTIPATSTNVNSTPAKATNNVQPTNNLAPVDTTKKITDTVYHVVEQGETFYSISRQYKVKITDIISWNHFKEYKIDVGQKIVVGAPEPTFTPASQSFGSSTFVAPKPNSLVNDKYHIVQPKQTLFTIAKMYNTTIDNLKQWNSLSGNAISIGQKLIVKP